MKRRLNLTVEEWYPYVHAALRNWRQPVGAVDNPLANWQLFLQKLSVIHDDRPTMNRLVLNEVLQTQLNTLGQQDAELLQRRYLDNESVLAVAGSFHMEKDPFLRRQRKAVQALTAQLIRAEQQARDRRTRQVEAGLYPPTYYELFGVDEALDELEQMLLNPDGAPVLALVGLGGVGKTALADALARRVIRHFYFEQIVWLRVGGPASEFMWPAKRDSPPTELEVDGLMTLLAQSLAPHMSAATAPRQRNAQLRSTLKAMPYLIIIDNLETPGSAADWAGLLPDLATPSRFLLTSRTRVSNQAGIYHFQMSELSAEHAGELVRAYGQQIGTMEMASLDQESVQQIYDVVGGNPMALKLVVSLAGIRPLADILADLRKAYSPKTESMYQGIYWQAWRGLSPPAQVLLEIMPMAGDNGMAPAQMQRLSRLDDAALWPAIDELAQRSLLEIRGDAQERRYAIHRLTESFLHTAIIGWTRDSL